MKNFKKCPKILLIIYNPKNRAKKTNSEKFLSKSLKSLNLKLKNVWKLQNKLCYNNSIKKDYRQTVSS